MDTRYCVTAVDSAEAALAQIEREGPPDVLVSDLSLPGQSGLDLVKSLGHFTEMKVLLVSGHFANPEEYAYRFLQKPFSSSELHHAVKTLLIGQASP